MPGVNQGGGWSGQGGCVKVTRVQGWPVDGGNLDDAPHRHKRRVR